MSTKDKWKKFGKNTGKAFTNFGKAVGETAKIAFTDEENSIEENGHRKLSNSWKETGKSFGEAGKALGKAAASTGKKIIGENDTDDEVKVNSDDVIDV